MIKLHLFARLARQQFDKTETLETCSGWVKSFPQLSAKAIKALVESKKKAVIKVVKCEVCGDPVPDEDYLTEVVVTSENSIDESKMACEGCYLLWFYQISGRVSSYQAARVKKTCYYKCADPVTRKAEIDEQMRDLCEDCFRENKLDIFYWEGM